MNAKFRIFVFAVLAVLFSSTSLFAQHVKGKFTLPYQVTWGQAVLERGDYTFHLEGNNTGIVSIHHNDRTLYVKLGYMDEVKVAGRQNEVVLVVCKDKPCVHELYVADLDTAFRFDIPDRFQVSHQVITKVSKPEVFANVPVAILEK